MALQSFPSKPRVFIISDISNEPDDAESLVRYLLYGNQFQTEGLVACTSTWMKTKVCPQDMHKIIDAYAHVVDNLNQHGHPDHPYPSAAHLKSLIKSGPPVYGFAGVGADVPLTDGHELLLERIQAADPDPLWILCWGGTNVLAQVLQTLQRTTAADVFAALRAKLRIYAISDQDDTGAWIRTSFPDLFYIASVHAWNMYGAAAWSGISGEHLYGFDQGGPDGTKTSKAWLQEHIQIGPLGSAYPTPMFIPEGDTPTFLYLIQNGLGVPEHPEYGSWGGRYGLVNGGLSGPLGDRGGLVSGHHADLADAVVGQDGRTHRSNHATIWRWRDAYQNDFAARMRWTLTADRAAANHHPVAAVNGDVGLRPVYLEAAAGSTVRLNATGSYDPDGDALSYKWWHYREPSATQWQTGPEVAEVAIVPQDAAGLVVDVTLPPPGQCCVDLITRQARARGQVLHVILEVTDAGTPALTTYRRILIQTTNEKLEGGQPLREAAGDWREAEA